jgi:hypothetical protein
LIHITCKILDSAVPVFFWSGDAAKALHQARNRLRYRKANYAAAHTADGKVMVISTVPLDAVPELPPFGAAERFAEALLNLSSRRRPIATSQDWRRQDQEQTTRKYRRAGSAPEGCFGKVVRQLQADHIEPTVLRTPKGEKGLFALPVSWPEERVARYLAGLGWGIDPAGAEVADD